MGLPVFKTGGAAPGVARWVRLPCAPAMHELGEPALEPVALADAEFSRLTVAPDSCSSPSVAPRTDSNPDLAPTRWLGMQRASHAPSYRHGSPPNSVAGMVPIVPPIAYLPPPPRSGGTRIPRGVGRTELDLGVVSIGETTPWLAECMLGCPLGSPAARSQVRPDSHPIRAHAGNGPRRGFAHWARGDRRRLPKGRRQSERLAGRETCPIKTSRMTTAAKIRRKDVGRERATAPWAAPHLGPGGRPRSWPEGYDCCSVACWCTLSTPRFHVPGAAWDRQGILY